MLLREKENVRVMRDNLYKLAGFPETATVLNLEIVIHLESITWDCSKEGWKPFPITQAGTCRKITHLQSDIQFKRN